MSKVTVRPASRDVRVPIGGGVKGVFFPDDQDSSVERTRYIERRIADKDLIEVKGPPTPAAPPAPVPVPPAEVKTDAPADTKAKAGS